MNYDRTAANSIAESLTANVLTEYLNGEGQQIITPQQRSALLAMITAPNWVNPSFKRHPLTFADEIDAGDRQMIISPVSDENELVTRDVVEFTIKLCLTHIYGLGGTNDEPTELELENEIAIDELIIQYLMGNPIAEFEIASTARMRIYDFERAQSDRIFHSTLIITARIEQPY